MPAAPCGYTSACAPTAILARGRRVSGRRGDHADLRDYMLHGWKIMEQPHDCPFAWIVEGREHGMRYGPVTARHGFPSQIEAERFCSRHEPPRYPEPHILPWRLCA